MSQTIPDVTIGSAWVSLNTAANIPIGTAFSIHNKSKVQALLYEGARPSPDLFSGDPLTDLSRPYAHKQAVADSLEVWCRSTHTILPVILSVQLV